MASENEQVDVIFHWLPTCDHCQLSEDRGSTMVYVFVIIFNIFYQYYHENFVCENVLQLAVNKNLMKM